MGGPEQGLQRCFADGHNQSLVSSVAQVAIVAVTVIYAFRPFVSVVSMWRYLCDTSLRNEIYK